MFEGWSKFEKRWLGFFSGIIFATTIIFSVQYTDWSSTQSILLNWVISPLSALTGILSVVLCAKGNVWNYFWGVINVTSYAYVAYQSGYYGDVILNVFWFLPMQPIGLWVWMRNRRKGSKTIVKMRKLTAKQAVAIALIGIVATVAFGFFLNNVDNWFTGAMKRNTSIYTYLDNTFGIPLLGPMLDASTETLQIIGQLLMTYFFAEQWIFWILTNIITIIMWGTVVVADKTTIAWALPTVIMWVAYLVNSVYGWMVWKKGAKEDAANV